MNKGKLLDILVERTSLDEIDHMLFDLDVPQGEFTGPQSKKIRSLITYLEQRNRLNEIPDWIIENRSDIDLTAALAAPDDEPFESHARTVLPQTSRFAGNSSVWIAALATVAAAVVTGLLAIFSNDIRCAIVTCNDDPKEVAAVITPTETNVPVAEQADTETPILTDTPSPDLTATFESSEERNNQNATATAISSVATQDAATKQAILEIADRETKLSELIDEEIAQGNARNLQGLLDLMSPDIEIVSRNNTLDDLSDDLYFNGYAGAAEFYSNFFDLDWVEYTLSNVEVLADGDEGTVTHEGTISDGTLFPDRVTYNLEYTDGTWLITNIEVGALP